jgi:hypothetical protein
MEGNVAPKADQPRVSQKDLQRGSGSANLQYRVEGIKSSNNRNPSSRKMKRN